MPKKSVKKAKTSFWGKVKSFFKPTTVKVITTVILGIMLTYLFSYSMMYVSCSDPPCKNLLLEKIGIIVNIIPFLFLLLVIKGQDLTILPFPIDFILVSAAYFVVPFLWAYFLVCLISWIVKKLKLRNKK